MPPSTEDQIIELCSLLASEENLQVTVKESLKGGAIAGICTVAGGVVGGPAGLAVGGAMGGCLAAYLAQDKFLPVSTVSIAFSLDILIMLLLEDYVEDYGEKAATSGMKLL